MQRSGLMQVSTTLVILAFLAVLAGCGQEEQGERVIIHDLSGHKQGYNLYAEAGGLGGTVAWVNVGEFATMQEERIVGKDVTGAIPGEWVRVRTLYDPREGWLPKRGIRPAPER